jgi:hypothetical protein
MLGLGANGSTVRNLVLKIAVLVCGKGVTGSGYCKSSCRFGNDSENVASSVAELRLAPQEGVFCTE